jgi:hypothetical protein
MILRRGRQGNGKIGQLYHLTGWKHEVNRTFAAKPMSISNIDDWSFPYGRKATCPVAAGADFS